MASNSEQKLRELLAQYDQKIFSLCLSLMQGNRDQAYEIATSAFAEAARHSSDPSDYFSDLVREVIKIVRRISTPPRTDEAGGDDLNLIEKKMRVFMHQILYQLPLDERTALILRDQLNISYPVMAKIFGLTYSEMRHRTLEARKEIRIQLEALLRDAR